MLMQYLKAILVKYHNVTEINRFLEQGIVVASSKILMSSAKFETEGSYAEYHAKITF